MPAEKMFLPHYTYADYENWEGQWELIDGLVYAMSPAPSIDHQRIAGNVFRIFSDSLNACEECNAYLPIDYVVKRDTVLQPDILIICGKPEKKYLDFPPSLVVEVLSPATALKDKHTKFGIYQSEGIPYYLIISPAKQKIEIYRLNDGEYELAAQGKELSFEFVFGPCSAAIDFGSVWQG